MKLIISTPDAPTAVGPYSQGVIAGNLLFISGQDVRLQGIASENAMKICKYCPDNNPGLPYGD